MVFRNFSVIFNSTPIFLLLLNGTIALTFHEIVGSFGYNHSYPISNAYEYTFIYKVEWTKDYEEKDIKFLAGVETGTQIDHPVTFIIRQDKKKFEWELPMETSRRTIIYDASKTLCKELGNIWKAKRNLTSDLSSSSLIMDISVHVYTASSNSITFWLVAQVEDLSLLTLNIPKQIELRQSSPTFIFFPFITAERVQLKVTSEDMICVTVSVQDATCPILEQEKNPAYKNNGHWQTMTQQAGMILKRQDFPRGIYVVFLIHSSDNPCQSTAEGITEADLLQIPDKTTISGNNETGKRLKMIEVVISEVDTYEFTLAVILVFVVIIVVVIIAIAICLARDKVFKLNDIHLEDLKNGRKVEKVTLQQNIIKRYMSQKTHDERLNEVDWDTSRDSHYEAICTTILTSIFFSIPAFNLMMVYSSMLFSTGNMDLCFYNYLCSNPFWIIYDFNHVFSNAGYILLPIPLLFVVYAKQISYHKMVTEKQNAIQTITEEYYFMGERIVKKRRVGEDFRFMGVSNSFGLSYCLLVAIMMEGVLSSLYHLCPSESSFQYDVFFMYITSVLSMYKLYKARHPSNSYMHAAFGFIAFGAFCNLAYFSGKVSQYLVRAIFTIVSGLGYFYITKAFYWNGSWKWKDSWMLIVALIANAVYLVVANFDPFDFATNQLILLLLNSFLYFGFYFGMKVCECCNSSSPIGKSMRKRPLFLIFASLAVTLWICSIVMFAFSPIAWDKSPAESRTKNKTCTFLVFDFHDLWHFLSAIALCFTFLVLFTIDDDLVGVDQFNILIF